MKVLATLALCLILTGCTATATPPTAPAIGYNNTADQQMGEILAGAHSFYTSIQAQSAARTLTLTPAEKTAFNDFGTALNTAQSIYLAYHAGTQTQATAQAAVDTVQSKQAALPLPGAKP